MITLTVDPFRCNGCHSCEVACSTFKDGVAGLARSRIQLVNQAGDGRGFPLVCIQCEAPGCASVCPTSALHRDTQTGVVTLDSARCIGCRMCMLGCAYGAIIEVDGMVAKCDLCGGAPMCVRFCEPGALAIEAPGGDRRSPVHYAQ